MWEIMATGYIAVFKMHSSETYFYISLQSRFGFRRGNIQLLQYGKRCTNP